MGDSDAVRSLGTSPRWLKLALVVSLMVNMLFVGAIAGQLLMRGKHHGHRGGGIADVLRALPEARRKEVGAVWEQNRAEMRAHRDEVRRLRRAARDVIAKEPFDADAARAALAAVSAARAHARARMGEAFVDTMSKLTPQERQIFREQQRWHHRARHDL